MLRILIVEDSAERAALLCRVYGAHDLVVVDDADCALRELQADNFDLVSLDYDLANGDTGDVVARYLAEKGEQTPQVVIHSANPEGVNAIQSILPDAIALPISTLDRSNHVYGRLVAEFAAGRPVDWAFVLTGQR